MWSQPLSRPGHRQRLRSQPVPSPRPARRRLRSQPLPASGALQFWSLRCLCLRPARPGWGVCRQSVPTPGSRVELCDGCTSTSGRREADGYPRRVNCSA